MIHTEFGKVIHNNDIKVWVNGTFDVLHIGHIRLLEYASKFGKLRVGIDTDERVRKLKGLNRPFNSWEDRVDMMQSIKYVDSVVGFSTDEELKKEIEKWSPKIMVIGSDYMNKKIIGSELIDIIFYYDRIGDHSTTKILNQ